MIEKILMVTTPSHDMKDIISAKRSKATGDTQKGRQLLPSGLMSIGAYLESKGYHIDVEDFWTMDWNDIKNRLIQQDPDIIFSSCLTDSRLSSFKLARIAKEINPNVINVIGNAHASSMYNQILSNYPEIDYIVIGEGEITCHELLACLNTGGNIKEVKGLVFKSEGKIYVTEKRPLAPDLDIFPFPKKFRFNPAQPDVTTISTSRGCPYGCTYCSLTHFWGNWRGKTTKSVLEEIEFLASEGAKYITFNDDHFTFNKKRAIEIASHFHEYDFKWRMQCRVDRIDKEMLTCFAKNNIDMIAYGVETMSPTIIKNIQKGVTLQQVHKAFELSHEANIPAIQSNIVIGLPGETQTTINETIKGLKIIKPDEIGKFIAMVLPSTGLYEIMKEKKILTDDYWLSSNPSPFFTAENDLPTLRKYSLQVQLAWYKQRGLSYTVKDIYTLLSDHGIKFAADYISDGLSRIKITDFLRRP